MLTRTLSIIALATMLGLAGCVDNDGPAEELGESIDDAAAEVSEGVENACEDVADGVDAEDANCG